MRRTIIEVALALLGIVGYTLFERHRGAAECIADNKEAVHEQDVHNAEMHGAQVSEVEHEAKDYKDAIVKPVAGAPLVRVCPRAKPMPAPSPPGSVDHGEASLRGANQEVPAVIDWDSRPVVQSGRDADVQIEQLENYITNVCQRF
jgi:hypothetical protein